MAAVTCALSTKTLTEEMKKLSAILKQWMDETGDSIPKKITKDWYTRDFTTAGTEDRKKKIRGEMPGASNNATSINHKGPF